MGRAPIAKDRRWADQIAIWARVERENGGVVRCRSAKQAKHLMYSLYSCRADLRPDSGYSLWDMFRIAQEDDMVWIRPKEALVDGVIMHNLAGEKVEPMCGATLTPDFTDEYAKRPTFEPNAPLKLNEE